ncbi:hypothetical protein [Pseudoduganella armeniaca]|uniref:hypothetical protein n=1 Tax=Pseudoduganella armeniaca TaxID=2072590 RepID=UPI0011B26521|nr:hypothetical protein [Pseudoduganella armeniaca]
MRHLPYPGYTWSFTQHAVGIEATTLYGLLACASLFEGQSGDYGAAINTTIINSGLLTANIRDGVADAWRDYQQILAELGLIYSTKICRTLKLTRAGHMYLAGELGYADLMGIQNLRYQYPNGQKSTIQSRQSIELATAGITRPPTLLELQVNSGILVKPGTLLLRLLVELYNSGNSPWISIDECLAFALPCKRNDEWPMAYSEILAHRQSPSRISVIYPHARRNVQDWFKFLSKSDIFDVTGNRILLTENATENLSLLMRALTHEESLNSFWIPASYDLASRLKWFDWFGQIDVSAQRVTEHPLDERYIQKNFVGGIESDDIEEMDVITDIQLRLTTIDIEELRRTRDFNPIREITAEGLERINLGAFRRHSKTLLHDRIVASLSAKLQAGGAIVGHDRNSVDLLARWSDANEAIFEVKTVTLRSLSNRLRMATGQLQEYAYRRKSNSKVSPDIVIVINTKIPKDSWQVDFLVNHLNIGLLFSSSDEEFSGIAPENCTTSIRWL